MSQFWTGMVSSGGLPPVVATSYTTDNGTAVPAANILDIRGIDASSAFVSPNTNSGNNNNINGIVVIGGATQAGASNRVDVQLTNRIHGIATTTDAITPVNMYTFALGTTPGTYLFTTRAVVFNLTDSLSASYASYRCVRTDGAVATLIGATSTFTIEEGAMSGLLLENSVSGNNAVLNATGLALKTLHFLAITEYQFVS